MPSYKEANVIREVGRRKNKTDKKEADIMEWRLVAKTRDIDKGTMKLIEVGEKKVVVANLDGRYYVFKDRCPHMNAPLHMGILKGNVLACPMHYSTFDVTTRRKLSDPKLGMPPEMMKKLPEDFLQMYSKWGEIMAEIETYDLETYEVKIEGESISIRVE